jgi:molecular chaperone GrpE
MSAPEPWAARSELREALAEAIASYAGDDEAAATPAEHSAGGANDPGDDGTTRPTPARSTPDAPSRRQPPPGGEASEHDHDTARAQTTTAERDQYLDHLRRLQAEFDNYRKRVQRDSEALVLRAGEGLIESLLPVLDNLQRTLEAAAQHEEGQLIKGVELVCGQLHALLEGQGLAEVAAAPGLPFDPTVHEALVAQDSAEHPAGAIVAVIAPGYLLHGRLLRPARVIVAS